MNQPSSLWIFWFLDKWTKPDVGGDEPTQSVGAGVSSYPFDRLRASLKLGRTIADLAGCKEIQLVHLAEALQYRSKLMLG
jgi:hypothetical protein